eukprot:COSAG02_NODE_2435_length_8869_cov_63.273774_3_plen_165_part_00
MPQRCSPLEAAAALQLRRPRTRARARKSHSMVFTEGIRRPRWAPARLRHTGAHALPFAATCPQQAPPTGPSSKQHCTQPLAHEAQHREVDYDVCEEILCVDTLHPDILARDLHPQAHGQHKSRDAGRNSSEERVEREGSRQRAVQQLNSDRGGDAFEERVNLRA